MDADRMMERQSRRAQGGARLRGDLDQACRVILLAVLANIAFKGAFAMVLGSAALRGRVAAWFGLALAGGIAIMLAA